MENQSISLSKVEKETHGKQILEKSPELSEFATHVMFKLPGFKDNSDLMEPENHIEIAEDVVFEFRRIWGTLELAMCYERAFFPQFVEFDGMVFLKDKFSENYYNTLKTDLKEPKKIQIALNYFTMDDLFSTQQYYDFRKKKETKILADTCMRYLAGRFCHAWKLSLKDCFPHKNFSVYYERTGNEDVWGLTFYEAEETFLWRQGKRLMNLFSH